MVADALDHLDFLLAIFIPIVDIVDTVLLLQSLQKRLVFYRDPLRLLVTSSPVQRFGNGLSASVGENFALRVGLFSVELGCVGWNRRHVPLLVLREVLPGTSQDTSHAFQQDAIGFLDLSAAI